MTEQGRGGLWDAPVTVWLYGLLRAGSLGLPVATGTGIGIGLLLVPPLLYFVARGSARAWGILLVFDSLSFALLLATLRYTEAAPAVVWLSGGALALLLAPSVRRWVTRDPAEVEPAGGPDG